MNDEARHQKFCRKKWTHPSGKLREQGAHTLSDAELLAILISAGIKGKTAEEIAQEIISKYGSFYGMANQPLEKFLEFRGISDRKIIRIAAAFEIGKRLAKEIVKYEKTK